MVARWANDTERAAVLLGFLQALDRREHRPSGQTGGEQTPSAHHRVRVESTPAVGVDADDVIEERTVVDETDLVVGHEPPLRAPPYSVLTVLSPVHAHGTPR